MLELSEKLKKISEEVLGEATQSAQKQWEAFLEEQKREYNEKEIAYLEEGYSAIQSGLKKLEKEKSSRLSKALMENHRQILQKRMQIVDAVFAELERRLLEFTETEEYIGLLKGRIRRTLEDLGEGQKRIVLTQTDFERRGLLEKEFPEVTFEVENHSAQKGILGGCLGYQVAGNIFCDASFSEQIREQKESFLQATATELKIVD